MIGWLNVVLFHLGSDAVSRAELLGFLTGAAAVYLTWRNRVSNFWVGIVNSALFLVLFYSAHLWADAGLQVVFIVLGFTGWWNWLRGNAGSELPVRGASTRLLLTVTGAGAAATLGLWWLLTANADAAPFLDALTTALSLAAQWLLNARRWQNWLFWIAADLIYIPLYVSKNLQLTSIVYVLFLIMCLFGLRDWLRASRTTSDGSDASDADVRPAAGELDQVAP